MEVCGALSSGKWVVLSGCVSNSIFSEGSILVDISETISSASLIQCVSFMSVSTSLMPGLNERSFSGKVPTDGVSPSFGVFPL